MYNIILLCSCVQLFIVTSGDCHSDDNNVRFIPEPESSPPNIELLIDSVIKFEGNEHVQEKPAQSQDWRRVVIDLSYMRKYEVKSDGTYEKHKIHRREAIEIQESMVDGRRKNLGKLQKRGIRKESPKDEVVAAAQNQPSWQRWYQGNGGVECENPGGHYQVPPAQQQQGFPPHQQGQQNNEPNYHPIYYYSNPPSSSELPQSQSGGFNQGSQYPYRQPGSYGPPGAYNQPVQQGSFGQQTSQVPQAPYGQQTPPPSSNPYGGQTPSTYPGQYGSQNQPYPPGTYPAPQNQYPYTNYQTPSPAPGSYPYPSAPETSQGSSTPYQVPSSPQVAFGYYIPVQPHASSTSDPYQQGQPVGQHATGPQPSQSYHAPPQQPAGSYPTTQQFHQTYPGHVNQPLSVSNSQNHPAQFQPSTPSYLPPPSSQTTPSQTPNNQSPHHPIPQGSPPVPPQSYLCTYNNGQGGGAPATNSPYQSAWRCQVQSVPQVQNSSQITYNQPSQQYYPGYYPPPAISNQQSQTPTTYVPQYYPSPQTVPPVQPQYFYYAPLPYPPPPLWMSPYNYSYTNPSQTNNIQPGVEIEVEETENKNVEHNDTNSGNQENEEQEEEAKMDETTTESVNETNEGEESEKLIQGEEKSGGRSDSSEVEESKADGGDGEAAGNEHKQVKSEVINVVSDNSTRSLKTLTRNVREEARMSEKMTQGDDLDTGSLTDVENEENVSTNLNQEVNKEEDEDNTSSVKYSKRNGAYTGAGERPRKGEVEWIPKSKRTG